jgi:hypothetical protein
MNIAKTHAATAPVHHERTQTEHKSAVNPKQENQPKHAAAQAVQETKKTTEPKTEKVQKGGEINITA